MMVLIRSSTSGHCFRSGRKPLARMRTLALGKLFPQLMMPLSPANLPDSSGDWLTPFFRFLHAFCFFFSLFFLRSNETTVKLLQ